MYGWEVECSCKHKHTDHSPVFPFTCMKQVGAKGGGKKACDCEGFDANWVCNCGHPWRDHETVATSMSLCEGGREWVVSEDFLIY